MNDTYIDTPSRNTIIKRKIGGWVIIALSPVYLFSMLPLFFGNSDSFTEVITWVTLHQLAGLAIAIGGAHLIDRSDPTPPLTNKTKRRVLGVFLIIYSFYYQTWAPDLLHALPLHIVVIFTLVITGGFLLRPEKRK